MKVANSEKGYSLLLTLVIIILFSILGASLIAMTFNGVTKNESRESITQSKDLATKAENFIISDINKNTKLEIENTEILTSTTFNQQYTKLLKNYYCNSTSPYLKKITVDINKNNSTGTSTVCIETVEPYNESLTKMKVTFRSIGLSNSHETPLVSTYLMGAQEAKESLKYSVSTFIPPNGNGGNLFLHGGSEIEGDMNIQNNLFITSYSYGLNKWLESIPSRTLNSNLFLKNNIYTFNNLSYSSREQNLKYNSNTLQYSTHLNTNFNSIFYKMIQPVYYSLNNPKIVSDNGFAQNYGPKLYKNEGKDVYYNVEEGFKDIKNQSFSNKPTNATAEYDCFLFWCSKWQYTKIDTRSTHIENTSVKYNGDLYITGNTKVEFKKPVYITGDLIIGNHTNNSNSPSDYLDITLNGTTIYVGGKVRIQGVNLNANANLYVKGSDGNNFFISRSSIESDITTGFRQLTLNGLGKDGSLIVFSKGDTQIANISVNEPKPSTIKGYFYTEGAMELYGFGSNLHINGGISANNIILNAMRGDSLDSCKVTSNYQIIGNICYEKASNQTKTGKSTRLAIIYNKDILETYSKNQENIFSNITENDVIDKVQLLDRKIP